MKGFQQVMAMRMTQQKQAMNMATQAATLKQNQQLFPLAVQKLQNQVDLSGLDVQKAHQTYDNSQDVLDTIKAGGDPTGGMDLGKYHNVVFPSGTPATPAGAVPIAGKVTTYGPYEKADNGMTNHGTKATLDDIAIPPEKWDAVKAAGITPGSPVMLTIQDPVSGEMKTLPKIANDTTQAGLTNGVGVDMRHPTPNNPYQDWNVRYITPAVKPIASDDTLSDDTITS
jgi:hypothetical protein